MPGRSPGDASGWSLNDIGHTALDVFGILPVVGEAADITNAVWYAAEEQYLDAGLSLISTIPIVGDLIGKGAKAAKRLGPKASAEVLKALKTLDIAKHLDGLRVHPKLGPHIDKIQAALRKWQADLAEKADTASAGKATAKCPDTLRMTSNGLVPKVNPDKTTTILGRWDPDMMDVKRQINKPFLDQAIERGDDIVIATDPFNPLSVFQAGLSNGQRVLTTFGKEIDHLYKNGYVYDAVAKAMVKK